MKIRLIQPSHLDARGKVHKFQRLFMPTLSLLTVAALTPRGVDVALSLDAVEDLDFDERVDLVGIGALTARLRAPTRSPASTAAAGARW